MGDHDKIWDCNTVKSRESSQQDGQLSLSWGKTYKYGKAGPATPRDCLRNTQSWVLTQRWREIRSRVEREKEVWGCREERHRERGFPALSERRYSESAGGLFFSALCIKVIFSIVSRYFVFFALGYLVLWESYSHLSTFYTHGLADRAYGLWNACCCFLRLFVHLFFQFSNFDLLIYLLAFTETR